MANGTVALEAVLRAFGIGPGDVCVDPPPPADRRLLMLRAVVATRT